MKRLFLTGVGAFALGFAVPAQGADLPKMVTKAPIVPVAVTPAWNGFYAGISAGGRWADVDGTTISFGGGAPPFPALVNQDYDSSTFRAGGYLGYNWQLSPNWLVGIEADLAWGDGSASVNALQGLPSNVGNFSEFRHQWDGGIRGRVGYLMTPTWLLYLTGGAQWQHVEAKVTCPTATCTGSPFTQTNDTTLLGWTIGGGMEALVSRNWLARLEYRYADFGTWNTSFGPAAVAIVKDFDVKTHTAFAGLAYKF